MTALFPRYAGICAGLLFAALLFLATPAPAVDIQPGDSCAAFSSGVYRPTGGPENPDGALVVCDGSIWQPILRYSSAGNRMSVGGGNLPAASLHVWGEAIIGAQGLACAAATEGGIRYNSTGQAFDYCDGSSWQNFGGGTAAGGDREIQFNSGGTFGTDSNFIFTSSGQLGIGTSGPAAPLHIDMGARAGLPFTNNDALFIGSGGAGTGNNTYLALGRTAETDGVSWLQAFISGVGQSDLSLNPLGGNVGIGTTTPSENLDVHADSAWSTINLSNNNSASGGSNIDLYTTRSDLTKYLTEDATNTGWSISARNGNYIAVEERHQLAYSFWDGSSLTQAVTFTSAGNIGIGTANPETLLHLRSPRTNYGDPLDWTEGAWASIQGPVDEYPGLTIKGFGGTVDYESPDIKFYRVRGDFQTPAETVSGDRIGSISARAYNATLDAESNVGYIAFEQTGAATANGNPGDIVFNTNDGTTQWGTPGMRLTSAGRLGIGTASPADKLQIAGGQLRIDNDTDGTDKGCLRYNGSSNELEYSNDCSSFQSFSASAGGGWTDDGTTVRLTTATDRVGIGSAAAPDSLNRLYIENTDTRSASDNVKSVYSWLDIEPDSDQTKDWNNKSSAISGYVNVPASNSNVVSTIFGVDGQGLNYGAGDVANLLGGHFWSQHEPPNAGDTVDKLAGLFVGAGSGGGTVGSIYGIDMHNLFWYGNNTATDFFGIRIENTIESTDTVENRYGLYLTTSGSGAPTTNDYGIYQDGGQDNYLSGNVGIGATSPWAPLHVKGVGTGGGLLTLEGTDNTEEISMMFSPVGAASPANKHWLAGRAYNENAFAFRSWDGTADSEIMRFSSAGNVGISNGSPSGLFEVGGGLLYVSGSSGQVGIGTTDPDARLHVNGSALIGGSSSGDTNVSLNGGGPASTRNISLYYDQPTETGKLIVAHGGVAWRDLAINPSGGNVGIGTNGPAYKFHVLGSSGDAIAMFRNANGSGDGIAIQLDSASPGSGNEFISFRRSDGTEIGEVDGNGSSSVSFNTTSDRRIKRNIRDTHYGIEDLMRVQVRDFQYLDDDYEMTGFIAQELYEIYPPAVSPGDKTEMWGIDYGKVTPIIVKAVQEQQAIIDRQQSTIDDLRAELESWKERIEALEAAGLGP